MNKDRRRTSPDSVQINLPYVVRKIMDVSLANAYSISNRIANYSFVDKVRFFLIRQPDSSYNHESIQSINRLIVSHVFFSSNSLFKIKEGNRSYSIPSIVTYLDFGCGNGTRTDEISLELRARGNTLYPSTDPLQANDSVGLSLSVYGIDVFPSVSNFGGNYIQFGTKEYNKFIISNKNSIDFITIFQVLHHIANPGKIVRMLGDLLSDRGLIVVKEHDYEGSDKHIKECLDLLHLKWDNELPENINLDDRISHITNTNYHQMQFWANLFLSAGMKEYYRATFTISNPQRIYWSVFGKKNTN